MIVSFIAILCISGMVACFFVFGCGNRRTPTATVSKEQKALEVSKEQKALELASRLQAGPLTRPEVIDNLGMPDRVLVRGNETFNAYFYDRFGEKDWFILIAYDKDGSVRDIAFNERNAPDFEQWESP